MAHIALLSEENIVTAVYVIPDDDTEERVGAFTRQSCKRCSYNTHGGVHVLGGTPFRKNYPGIGYTYDPVRDAFIPPKPDDNAILNEDTCLWELPQ